MRISIRKAVPDDLEWLIRQLREFSRFFGSKKPLFPTDEEHARRSMHALMLDHVVLVAERDGERDPLGFISGISSVHPFNPEIQVLTEAFWWVDERCRNTMSGGRAAGLLRDAFIAWGKANVDWIVFTLEHHSPVSDRALTGQGFHLHERSFLLEVL